MPQLQSHRKFYFAPLNKSFGPTGAEDILWPTINYYREIMMKTKHKTKTLDRDEQPRANSESPRLRSA